MATSSDLAVGAYVWNMVWNLWSFRYDRADRRIGGIGTVAPGLPGGRIPDSGADDQSVQRYPLPFESVRIGVY